MIKKVAIFTGNRAEYGLQVPILKEINKNPDLEYILIVAGAHLDPNFGTTVNEIQEDGFEIHEMVNIQPLGDDLISTSNTIGQIVVEITKIIKKYKPDIFLVYADRFETFAAAIAASQTNTPTAHVEGGDITEGGALDDSVRHAITKLSHLHFATNDQAKNRILAMGEENWRVHTVGYPGIDLININDFYDEQKIENLIGVKLNKPIIICTQHSVSNKFKLAQKQLKPTLDAIKKLVSDYDVHCIITYPNNDAGGKDIFSSLEDFAKINNSITLYQSLGRKLYWGLLNLAKNPIYNIVCVGNSSSGIKETPAFGCPVVNIGTRQSGRLKGTNVIDCDYNSNEIYNAMVKCLYDLEHIQKCRDTINPYGTGDAGKKIVKVLQSTIINDDLLTKKMTIRGEKKSDWFR